VLSIGFTLAYAPMFSKVWTIYRLTTRRNKELKVGAQRSGGQRVKGMVHDGQGVKGIVGSSSEVNGSKGESGQVVKGWGEK
jgi:hypothetical protein